MSRHWKMAVLAAAGFATITATTTLVAVTDDGKAQANASAVADQGKGGAQPAVVKKATTRGGGPEDEDGDGDYWSERAGNPDGNDRDDSEDNDDYSGNHEAGTGRAAAGSGKREGGKADEGHSDDHGGKSDGGAADAQKRSGDSSGHGEKNGPGKGARDGGGDSGRESGRGGGGDGQGGHREGSGREGEGWQGRGGHDDSGEAHGKARLVDCDPNDLIWAITQANNDGGGTLTLAEKCTYTLTVNQDGNGLPEIIQPITIDGNGATITRAANADQFRFFEVGVGGDLKLRHLTLTRGKSSDAFEEGGAINVNAAGRLDLDCVTLHNNTVNDIGNDDGGAIYNEGIVKISNSTISKNSSYYGAIYNYYGKLEIETSKFTGNLSNSYAGAVNNESGTTTIRKSLFSYNYGYYGGALYSEEGTVDVDKSAFLYNHSGSDGGAIYNDDLGMYIRRSTVAYNTAEGDGGGVYLYNRGVIADSKIYNNTAVDGDGGGIYLNSSYEWAVQRTAVAGNSAPGEGHSGGGIYVQSSGGILHLTDSKITDNTSDEEAGGVDNNGTVNVYGRVKIIDNVPTNCEGSANDVPNCFG
ncbi:right-handed parallel beta-helix repeat-containing protein [Streptomyces sp. NPDC059165]|uniref:right-handed parallel beta-helix repeat-containing protein n=1 Tax=Streptomyces sp. NPDC059165 TaxID=3346751 RepID=UPI00369EF059